MIWTIEGGKMDGVKIKLLTLGQLRAYQQNAPDSVFVSVDGEQVKARDCGLDTRLGYMAYGQIVSSLDGR